MVKNYLLKALGFLLGWLLFVSPVYASDHQDAPKMMAQPPVDITDLFAFMSPSEANHLVLILNASPLATESSWFSDSFKYGIAVRPATISGTGAEAGFAIADQEFRFDCSFNLPVDRPWRWRSAPSLIQRGRCTAPGGTVIPVVVDDPDGTQSGGVRVFTGHRLDSFFLDFGRIAKGQLGPNVEGKNSLQNKNVLGIVFDIDLPQVLGSQPGSLYAVVGEVNTETTPMIHVDRQGRSEMTNITLLLKQFDQVNQDLDVRDLYNQENTFKLSKDYIGTFRARFNANLAFWDNVDQKIDWPPRPDGQHPLTDLLINDVLVIDTAKPCTEQGYFAIETALIGDRPYDTCGGRMPNDDTVDDILTLYINGGNGPRIGDGVNQATVPASNTFPYLAPPQPG